MNRNVEAAGVIVLAQDGVWTRRCIGVLAENGYQAERRNFVWTSIEEKSARRLIFICSIPSPQDRRFFLVLRPEEHGGRIAKYFGKGLSDEERSQSENKGQLCILKSEDPDFKKLVEWIKDPIAQAAHVAKLRDDWVNERMLSFLHDPK